MRIIGLDVGTKRIGVAKADTSVRIAIPNGYVLVNGQEIPEILRIARLNDTNFFVVGLPRSNDGNETAQSAYARKFADTLAASMPGARIYFQDESLTSVVAEERLKKRKKNFEKGEIDAEAASIILQDFIEHYAAKLAQNAASKIPNQLVNPVAEMNPSFSPASTLGSPEVQSIINEPTKSESESSESPRPAKSSEKPMKKVKRILLSLFILLFLAGLFGGGYYWYSLQPVSSANCRFDSAKAASESNEKEADSNCEYQTIEVTAGESVKEIANNLKRADLIRNPFAFELYARINNLHAKLKTGKYSFRKTMSARDIAKQLVNGVVSSDVFNLTILPGTSLLGDKGKSQTSIIHQFRTLGYSEEEINQALAKHYDNPILKGLYADEIKLSEPDIPVKLALEGYLYGETYQFYNHEKLENVITTILNQFNDVVVSNQLEEKFKARGLSLREGITLASIIQKEANTEDMPGVSMVFQNRLKQGIALGSDVTATYAADITGIDRANATNADILAVNSLYNTRKFPGLPPGPIAVPSKAALLAVAEPDSSKASMLYFLTGDDGLMYYSSTDAEHNQKIRDHCQKLCKVQI
ncbi:MAG: endolytic transglycosylase MltG [Candidatus Nanosyncoccus sp. P13S_S20_bin.18.1]|nr:endolytic transglycosylase MltG [Candidatus Nanosyncoccus sp. P13S_S20_bin.18.1]